MADLLTVKLTSVGKKINVGKGKRRKRCKLPSSLLWRELRAFPDKNPCLGVFSPVQQVVMMQLAMISTILCPYYCIIFIKTSSILCIVPIYDAISVDCSMLSWVCCTSFWLVFQDSMHVQFWVILTRWTIGNILALLFTLLCTKFCVFSSTI